MMPPVIYIKSACFAVGGAFLITYLAVQAVRRWWNR